MTGDGMASGTGNMGGVSEAGGAGARGSPVDVGLMRLCGRDLAIRAASIREVVPLPVTLHADFSGADVCAGTIVIRGRAIPVLDIARHFGLDRPAGATGIVVVLRAGKALVGLVMDMVSGLARIAADQVQSLTVAGDRHRPLVTSGFLHGEALFGLIDEQAVFALPGVTHATEAGLDEQRAASPRGAVVLVSVADIQIAIDTAFVVATVPGDTITPSPEPGGPWRGVVRYLDREVPVIEDLALFGLTGRAAEGRGCAVVIVQLDEHRMLGVRIDRIRRILPLGPRSVQPLSAELRARLPLFKGAAIDHEGRQNLMLDHDAVRQSAALRTMAALTRRTGDAPVGQPGAASSGEQQAFVVFRAGRGHGAASLASVKQIVPFPADTVPVRCAGSALCGIASYGGAPLPLFELAGAQDDGGGDRSGRMILVVESDGACNGLVVERLETIARTVARPRPAAAPGHFIHAQVDGRPTAITVCDLAAQVRRLAGDTDVGPPLPAKP
jgi:purine-binding chemotaxis protein CheW